MRQQKSKQRVSSAESDKVKDQRAEQLKSARTKYLWRRLRETILDTANASLENDVKERHVTHGMQFYRQIMHRNSITMAFVNTLTQDYISVDDEAVRIYYSSGMRKDIVMPTEDINKICHIRHLNSFVGWRKGSPNLYLYGDDFELYSSTEAPSDIHQVLYNETKEELIACGTGYLQSYVFRFGNRHMIAKHQRMEHEVIEGHDVDIVVLEETASRHQKCFIAFENCVAVFNVANTEFVTWRKNLHSRDITSMLFFNPLKYLITAAFDGSIKVWTTDWKVQYVFVGHTKTVNDMALYPWGPQFMSVSEDSTLRVWNLEVFDQMEQHDLDEPAVGIYTGLGNKNLCTYSGHALHLWTIEDLHKVHTMVGFEVLYLKTTSHPSYPIRVLAISKDSAVRIMCPDSGEVITTLLLDPNTDKIVDLAYAIADELLFVVLEGGEILKCSTTTNPVTILARWNYPEMTSWCNYLLMYEYVIGNQSTNPWKNIARAFAAKHLEVAVESDEDEVDSGRSTPLVAANKTQDKTLLLGGRKDGYLCVLNWRTGQFDFEIEGHGSKGVLSMIANSPDDQVMSAGLAKDDKLVNLVISSGHDNVIKVWRLFPYAADSLAPMMSFYCSQTPLHMYVMTGKLGVAFHEHASATYSVVVYSLGNKSRKDHSPDDDHLDTITGLTACPRMRLFASSSLDGTVKVWSDTNKLVRHLKLNTTPSCLEFVDSKGTLLVGVGKNIHRIEHKDLLPQVYRFKQVTMRFSVSTPENPIPFDSKVVKNLDRKQLKRLQDAKPAYRYIQYSDELTEEEKQLLSEEQLAKKSAYDEVISRQEDVTLIRDGEVKAKNQPPRNKHTRSEAFMRYLSIFYDRPGVKIEDTLSTGVYDYNRTLYEYQRDLPFHQLQDQLFKAAPHLHKIFTQFAVPLVAIVNNNDLITPSHSANTLSDISRSNHSISSNKGSSIGFPSVKTLIPVTNSPSHIPRYLAFKNEVVFSHSSASISSFISSDASEYYITNESHQTSAREADGHCGGFSKCLEKELSRLETFFDLEIQMKQKKRNLNLTQQISRNLIMLYREDEFLMDTAKSRANPLDALEEEHQQYEDGGFFPNADTAAPKVFSDLLNDAGYNVEEDKPLLEAGKERRPIYPADPRGYIPNSVLVRLLFPEQSEEEKIDEDSWRPPRLTDDQLAEIGQTRAKELSRRYVKTWKHYKKKYPHLGPKTVADLAEEKALAAFQLQRENTQAERVIIMSDEEEKVSNDALLKKAASKIKTKKKKKAKVSFGFPDDTPEKSDLASPEPKKKGVGFELPTEDSGNKLMSKLNSILTKPPTPPQIKPVEKPNDRNELKSSPSHSKPKLTARQRVLCNKSTRNKTVPNSYTPEACDRQEKDILPEIGSNNRTWQTPDQSLLKESNSLSRLLNSHHQQPTHTTPLPLSKSENRLTGHDLNSPKLCTFSHNLNIDQNAKSLYKEALKAKITAVPKEPSPEPPPPPPAVKKQPTAPRKPLVKLVSKGPPPKPPKPKTPSPPPKEPTPSPPPPPPTPLPEYITQFIGETWFEQYFPNCNSYTFSKPWSVENLISQLLRILRMATYPMKREIADAIRRLYRVEGIRRIIGFKNTKEVMETCFEVLNPPFNPPTCLDDDQREVIKLLLQLLNEINCTSLEFYVELMTQFIDGDVELRKLVIDVMTLNGLNDHHGFFAKEMDSWDTWALEGHDRKADVGGLCRAWLEKWMSKFKAHLQEGIEMLRKGRSIHTRVNRGGAAKGNAKANAKKSFTVTFDEPPGAGVVERATWIECINYFCEMEQEAEIGRRRAQENAGEKLVETKNTVLVLPKLHAKPTLVRLGELHTGATPCKPERETVLSTQYDLKRFRKNANGEWALPPGQLHGFVPFIKQPMTSIYMNPFPSPIDRFDQYQHEPILITLKTSPKYFVQNESYPIQEMVM